MIVGKYWCPRKERHFKRTRLEGGAEGNRGIPWFMRSYRCWGCQDDCHEGRIKYHKEMKE